MVRRPKPPYWRGGTSFARKHVPPPFRGCSKAGLGLGANLPHYRLQGDEAPLLIHHQNGKIMLINAYGNFHTT